MARSVVAALALPLLVEPGAAVTMPSFVAIARPACARVEVEDDQGRVASRTVSFGTGGCSRAAGSTAKSDS
jgi:hypothetical protein